jgi:hypothetical protein
MPYQWIEYKGIKYLYLNYQDLDDVGIWELTLEFFNMLPYIEDKSLYLILDCTGLNVTYKTYTKIKDVAKSAQPKINKSVFVGLNSYSRTLYNVYRRFTGSKTVLLDTVDEALAYFEESMN